MSGSLHEVDRSSVAESSKPLLLKDRRPPEPESTPSVTSAVDVDDDKTRVQPPQTGNTAEGRPKIPPGIDSQQLELLIKRRATLYTPERHKTAWSNSAETVQKYSDQMVDQWNKEIDTYLVFAGLFSAILTAFNVQSYVLLQPAGRGSSAVGIEQNAAQMGTLTITHVAALPSGTLSPIPAWAIWLNGLWFSGLVLSLAPAFLGIMVKQWLDEFSRGLSGASRSVARARQYRLNNLKKWRVGDIVDIIPLLLQLALTCFLAGLLILLWTLHHGLAIVVSALVGVLAIFISVATFLPFFNASCAYLSPLIHILDNLRYPNQFKNWIFTLPTKLAESDTSPPWRWTRARSDEESTHPAGRRRFGRTFTQLAQLADKLFQSARSFLWAGSGHKQTRQGQEQSTINKVAEELDVQLLVEACSFTLRPEALSAATECLMGLKEDDVAHFFRQLRKSTRAHFGDQADESSGPLGKGNLHLLLWLQILLCVSSPSGPCLSSEDIDALNLYAGWGQWPSGMKDGKVVEWAIFGLSWVMEHLQSSEKRGNEVDELHRPGRLSGAMQALLSNAIHREHLLGEAVWQVIASSYRAVRLSQADLAKASEADAPNASRNYARNICHFLNCAGETLASSLPSKDPNLAQALHTYSGDVLTEMADYLLSLPNAVSVTDCYDAVSDKDSYYDIIGILANQVKSNANDPAVVLPVQCIPGRSVPDFIRMTSRLLDLGPFKFSSYDTFIRYLEDTMVLQRKLDEIFRSPNGQS